MEEIAAQYMNTFDLIAGKGWEDISLLENEISLQRKANKMDVCLLLRMLAYQRVPQSSSSKYLTGLLLMVDISAKLAATVS